MSAKHLPQQRWSDALAAFMARSFTGKRPRFTAIFCTHDFHPTPFERHLLPLLWRRGRRCRTLVLCDARALARHAAMDGKRGLGAYELSPVQCGTGVFHPKCFLLSDGLGNHLAGIGSANLTDGGMGGNLELFFTDEHDPVIGGLADFFRCLVNSPRIHMMASAKRFLEEALTAAKPKKSREIMHTLDSPLLPQMRSHLRGAVESLEVLSPWHVESQCSQTPDIVTAIRKEVGAAKITVYSNRIRGAQPESLTGPYAGPGTHVHVLLPLDGTPDAKPDAGDDDEVDAGNDVPGNLHAKAYRFSGAHGQEFLFVGSANCTGPALFRSVNQGGNVELMVHVSARLSAQWKGDLKRFFQKANSFADKAPTTMKSGPAGAILGGTILPGGRLRLEAADGTKRTHIQSAGNPRHLLTVNFRKGVCQIAAEKVRGLLPPHQDSNVRSGYFLAELVNGKPCLFPVTWSHRPVSLPGDCEPLDLMETLEDLLASLSGWTNRCPGGQESSDDRSNDETEEDEPKEALTSWLTESNHCGRLDHLALLTAKILRATSHDPTRRKAQRDHLLSVLRSSTTETDAAIRAVLLNVVKGTR